MKMIDAGRVGIWMIAILLSIAAALLGALWWVAKTFG